MAEQIKSWVIEIPNWTPVTLNSLINCHWATRGKRKKIDRDMIAFYGASIPKAERPRRIKLTITLGPKQKGADPDAFWKGLLDSLVHVGLLVNDSKEWVVLDPVQFERGKERATRIELFDLDCV